MHPTEFASDGAGVRVSQVALLVDDDVHIRSVLARLLTRIGYRVLQAENGAEALDILRHSGSPVDVVITDVWMPEMNGQTFAATVQRENPALPIVFISGEPPLESVQSLVDRGAGAFLAKPFSLDALEAVIDLAREQAATAD